VPWLHGLVKCLSQNPQQQNQQTNNFIAGEDWELETGSLTSRSPFRLAGPGGTEASVSCDNQGHLPHAVLTKPGIYSLRDKNDTELRRIAVNLPAQESDLAALAPTDFQKQLTRLSEPTKQTLAANLFGSSSSKKEFWTALLATALLLLLVEPMIANRTAA
jgi:hypothetical protein